MSGNLLLHGAITGCPACFLGKTDLIWGKEFQGEVEWEDGFMNRKAHCNKLRLGCQATKQQLCTLTPGEIWKK